MRTFRIVAAATLLSGGGTMAFNVGSKTSITPKVTSPSDGTSLFYVSEKPTYPTYPQIEEAAVKESSLTVKQPPKDWQACGAVQGTPGKTPGECCRYAFELTADPQLQAKLQQLTEKRPYGLFLLEKAAKTIGSVLPRTRHQDSTDDDAKKSSSSSTAKKEKVVILGSGWASAALLQDIDTDQFDVTVVSPRNYFLFTPLLASSSVGTVDIRSITRPIREFNRNANYLEAAASSIDVHGQTLTCQGVQCKEDECEIREIVIPYDRLVVAVGAKVNTFGIPGVEEHCFFLKQVADARAIRRRVVDLFEKANFPGRSEEEISKMLTFAIIGAGPTGVEFASELRDFIEQDGIKYYSRLLKYVKIKIIEASPSILAPFDESLREAAAAALTRKTNTNNGLASSESNLLPEDLTELIINKKVQQITKDCINLNDGTSIPFGLAVWAGGIGPLPITLSIIDAIGGRQLDAQKVARGKIAVDPWLRAINGNGRIFALGDCTCTQGACLPTTAQVAAQEGEFLAHILNNANLTAELDEALLLPPRKDHGKAQLCDSIASLTTKSKEYMAPFQFLDMGILAYTGQSSALAQVQADQTRIKAKGNVGFGLWRSVYFMKQASMRNRFLVGIDWTKARIFGRDITSID